jgi:hypothetical protein
MSFTKDFRNIFLRENIGFRKKLSTKVWGKAAVRLSRREGEMGHDARVVDEGETRRERKNRPAARYWVQRGKGI